MPKVKIELDHKDVTTGMTQMERTVNSGFNKMQKSAKNASSGVKSLQQSMQSLVSRAPAGLNSITSALAKIGPVGLAAAAAVAGIGLAAVKVYEGIKKVALRTDSLAKNAKALDMTANGYIALQYASSKAGIAMENMNSIVQKITYSIDKAAEGDKKYIEGFRKLGIYWRDLAKYSPEMRIGLVARRVAELSAAGKSIPTEAQDLWGKQNTKYIRQAGNEDLIKHFGIASIGGMTLSDDFLRAAEGMADDITEADLKFYTAIEKIDKQGKAMETLGNLYSKIGRLSRRRRKTVS